MVWVYIFSWTNWSAVTLIVHSASYIAATFVTAVHFNLWISVCCVLYYGSLHVSFDDRDHKTIQSASLYGAVCVCAQIDSPVRSMCCVYDVIPSCWHLQSTLTKISTCGNVPHARTTRYNYRECMPTRANSYLPTTLAWFFSWVCFLWMTLCAIDSLI